ncbi:Cinnamate reductase [anaerobic digester metagenome]
MKNKYQNLFKPSFIGKMELKNRIVMSPMGALLTDPNGRISDRYMDLLVERAKGGAGMIIPEAFMTIPAAGYFQHFITDESCVPRLSLLTDRVHAYGAKICCQMSAGLGRMDKIVPGGPIPAAASAIPSYNDPKVICHAMTIEEIHERENAYIPAAIRVMMSGFDCIEIHGHAGYLIDQFMSSEWNHRTDEYGGSLENRMRFSVNIVKNLRKTVGPNFPIIFRMSADHRYAAGRGIEETIEMVKILKDAGIDAVDVNTGCYGPTFYWMFPPSYLEDACMLDVSKAIKDNVNITVLNSGNHTPDTALKAVETGTADFIMMGRPLLADPDLPSKMKNGQIEDIRPCLRCNEYCVNEGLFKMKGMGCAVNPQVGRESYFQITKTDIDKKLVVIGGGPAGLEAARVAAMRGFNVTVYEKNGKIGGNAAVAATPEFKTIKKLISWYELQLKKLNVTIVLYKEIHKDSPELKDADYIIVALGGSSWTPSIPGLDSPIRLDVCDAHRNPNSVKGNNIVICGGGLSGVDSAIELSMKGKKVTVVEMLPRIAGDTCFVNQQCIAQVIKDKEIDVLTSHTVKRIVEDGVVIADADGYEKILKADTVITAFGIRPNQKPAHEIRDIYPNAILIGDCVNVKTIGVAIHEGFKRALTLD